MPEYRRVKYYHLNKPYWDIEVIPCYETPSQCFTLTPKEGEVSTIMDGASNLWDVSGEYEFIPNIYLETIEAGSSYKFTCLSGIPTTNYSIWLNKNNNKVFLTIFKFPNNSYTGTLFVAYDGPGQPAKTVGCDVLFTNLSAYGRTIYDTEENCSFYYPISTNGDTIVYGDCS